MSEFKEFWDNIHTNRSTNYITDGKVNYDNWLEKHLKLFSADGPILELGCGLGNNARYLAEKGFKVLATDFSSVALETVNKLLPQADTMHLDLTRPFPFENDKFPVIIADLCLHYFTEQKTKEIMLEIKRILKPGGFLLARVNTVDDINFGAGQGKRIEDNYYFTENNYKRFFDERAVKDFFGLIGKVDFKKTDMNRYSKPKKVFEIKVKKNLF